MLQSSIPEKFRKKTPLLYKENVIFRILTFSATMALGTFVVALVYYTTIVEPSPTTNMYDCGGHTCEQEYLELSGCKWPTFYGETFRFTIDSEEGDSEDGSGGDEHENGSEGEEYYSGGEGDEHEDAHSRRILQEENFCEPENGNYWIIAGQHYGAENSLENVLVRVTDYEFDMWSVINLSWNAASMTWTFSSAMFSLILSFGGDRFLNAQLDKGDVVEMDKSDEDVGGSKMVRTPDFSITE